MSVSLNSLIAILGSALLVAHVAFLQLHARRSRIHPPGRRRQTRVAANEALRRRLERKASRKGWESDPDLRTNLKEQLVQGR
jgi:hypothetical protein